MVSEQHVAVDLDIGNFGEADVRAEIVDPLLRRLGCTCRAARCGKAGIFQCPAAEDDAP